MPKNKKKVGHRQDAAIPEVNRSQPPDLEQTEEVNGSGQFRKREVSNNWTKYERDVHEGTSAQPEDYRDYKFLERNTNATNYFQLAEEKEWETQQMNPDQGLFSLNIKQLTAGIACLPFYEVLDIDKTLLTLESIERCDKIAESNVLRYRMDYLLSGEKKVDLLPASPNRVKVEEEKLPSVDPGSDLTDTGTAVVDDSSENDGELEDWLDSVLDN